MAGRHARALSGEPLLTLTLTAEERAWAAGEATGPARAMALRIVAETARILGASRLIAIASAHIDGCLYHGDSGTEFAEKLVAGGGKVAVPSTLNVGALDLIHPKRVHADRHRYDMALRMMRAYEALGCRPTWTCAPYQAGHRPELGEQVAWGESNAVAFVNSVLGARSNRYGDFLDIAAAIAGRAPYAGLHLAENRRARVVLETSALSAALKASDAFYPVLGTLLGREVGSTVAAIVGLPAGVSEDRLKALGAAAASTGAVGLFHVVGTTPEAPTLAAALGELPPERIIRVTAQMLRQARDSLSTAEGERIDAIALGSPHFSLEEFAELERLAAGRRFALPFYVCSGRGVLKALETEGRLAALERQGVIAVADTCVVVTPILPAGGGVLMTNSGKFAHYTPGNTGWQVVYGSLADCVATALSGRLERDERLWQ
ncbi:MAG TPA: aconitase X catalytic domain-containing protein [Alphaproteobacteria bacterium]|nr:aconitase X catalytic domain-containing protein [Alphaproteobacteria bacterium]